MEKRTGKKTANGLETKAFMVSETDIKAIKTIRQEEELSSDSAALRQLIRDGMLYRAMKNEMATNLEPRVQRQMATTLAKAMLGKPRSSKSTKRATEKSDDEPS